MAHLYRRESSDPASNAQINLAGRTHYVDDDTLRYFHARILSSRETDGGLLFAIIESSSGDANYITRIFRYVIFDIFGTVIDRPNIEQSWKSRAPAEKAMWQALNSIDAVEVTRKAIERERERFERETDRLIRDVEAIASEKAAV